MIKFFRVVLFLVAILPFSLVAMYQDVVPSDQGNIFSQSILPAIGNINNWNRELEKNKWLLYSRSSGNGVVVGTDFFVMGNPEIRNFTSQMIEPERAPLETQEFVVPEVLFIKEQDDQFKDFLISRIESGFVTTFTKEDVESQAIPSDLDYESIIALVNLLHAVQDLRVSQSKDMGKNLSEVKDAIEGVSLASLKNLVMYMNFVRELGINFLREPGFDFKTGLPDKETVKDVLVSIACLKINRDINLLSSILLYIMAPFLQGTRLGGSINPEEGWPRYSQQHEDHSILESLNSEDRNVIENLCKENGNIYVIINLYKTALVKQKNLKQADDEILEEIERVEKDLKEAPVSELVNKLEALVHGTVPSSSNYFSNYFVRGFPQWQKLLTLLIASGVGGYALYKYFTQSK